MPVLANLTRTKPRQKVGCDSAPIESWLGILGQKGSGDATTYRHTTPPVKSENRTLPNRQIRVIKGGNEMKELMKKMSMILLAIIGTLVGFLPVLMASVNTARHRNAKRFQFARQQLTTATESLAYTMDGVDRKRSGPDASAQAQIKATHAAYTALQEEVGKRLFRPDEKLFKTGDGLHYIYNYHNQLKAAELVLTRAARWVRSHIDNYVECEYCGAHGVSKTDICPQTLQPTTQIDEPYDVEVERNQYITDDEGNFSHMETITEVETRYRQHGKNHRGYPALDWAKTRYNHDTIEIAADWLGNPRNLRILADKYNESARDAAL